jgi:hypothetical protein
MHAAILFAKNKNEICVPQQWTTLIRMARRTYLYMIVPLKFGDIYDFKEFRKKCMQFRKEDVDGKKVNWLQIKWIRYTQENPDCIIFNPDCIMCKYNFEDEFRVLKVAGTVKRGHTAKPQELTRTYTSRRKISAAKKENLERLCRSGIIPSEYHDYYKSLS